VIRGSRRGKSEIDPSAINDFASQTFDNRGKVRIGDYA